MAIIVPAILEKTQEGFDDRLASYERLPDVERLQVDFCDGQFVDEVTLPIDRMDVLSPAFTWEAHLMVMEPVDFFDYQLAGFNIIIVHLESFSTAHAAQDSLKQIRSLGLKVGLAISPETAITDLEMFLPSIDQVTVLSVKPGAQGRAFIAETFARIHAIRQLSDTLTIEVDGGIGLSNAKSLAQAGADLLAVGSYLHNNPVEHYENLQDSLKSV